MFYQILNALCKKNNTTVTAVTKELNMSTSKVTAWKNGTIPNGTILIKIAQYFNVSTDYLLGLTDVPDKSYNMGKNDISDREQEILLLCRQLDEFDQAELKGYIKGILSADKYRVNPKENIG